MPQWPSRSGASCCWLKRLVQPHGGVPVSKPLEKMASGTTVSVALRMPLVPVLQLPAASRMRARTVYVPFASAPTGMVAVRPLNCVPLPGAGSVVVGGLIQYSPPATPLARPLTRGSTAPFTVSVTLAAPRVGFGASEMLVNVGAVLSMRSTVVAVAPQLPAASLPRT